MSGRARLFGLLLVFGLIAGTGCGSGGPFSGPQATPTVADPPSSSPPNAEATPTIGAAQPTAAPPGSVVSPTMAVGTIVEVVNTGQCLNVREMPGLRGAAVDCLPDGTKLRILGGPTESDSATWWQVTRVSVASSGWVSGQYLQVSR